jgi:hypothetical protein
MYTAYVATKQKGEDSGKEESKEKALSVSVIAWHYSMLTLLG